MDRKTAARKIRLAVRHIVKFDRIDSKSVSVAKEAMAAYRLAEDPKFAAFDMDWLEAIVRHTVFSMTEIDEFSKSPKEVDEMALGIVYDDLPYEFHRHQLD